MRQCPRISPIIPVARLAHQPPTGGAEEEHVKARRQRADARPMRRDRGSRRVLCLGIAIANVWGVWALLYETTGFPGLNYLAFGFVSLPVGAALFVASLIGYMRARARGCTTTDAVTAMLISAGVAVVPLAALVEFADYS